MEWLRMAKEKFDEFAAPVATRELVSLTSNSHRIRTFGRQIGNIKPAY